MGIESKMKCEEAREALNATAAHNLCSVVCACVCIRSYQIEKITIENLILAKEMQLLEMVTRTFLHITTNTGCESNKSVGSIVRRSSLNALKAHG